MKRPLLFVYLIFLLLIYVDTNAEASSQKARLNLSKIVDMALKKNRAVSIPDEIRKSRELAAVSASTYDNPVISFGKGSLQYNGGTGRANYDEFSISQSIPINGAKTNLKKQGQVLGELGTLEGKMLQFKLSSHAIIATLQFYTNLERSSHAEERLKNLKLVSNYLKSRDFRSPKQKMDALLVENKIDEIMLETRKVSSDLNASRQSLKLFIGDFDDDSLFLKLLEPAKVHRIIKILEGKKTFLAKKFKHINEVLDLKYKAASRQWIPDLQLYYTNTNERFSGGNHNQILGLGIEVPLFNIGKSKKEAATAQKAASKIEFEISQNKVLNNRNQNLALIRSALEFLKVYSEQKINLNDQKLRNFQKDFQKGLISAASFLELEDQDHMIHNKKLESYLAIYTGLLNLIEISGDTHLIKEIL